MSSFENPTIVVMAYKRLESMTRLLRSLEKAIYEGQVRLILSVDGSLNSENKGVTSFCNEFHWNYGEKKVICREKHLGIVQHAFACLGLTEEYDSIILLEDDHFISPLFYKASCEFLKFYSKEEKLFAFSLYNHTKNGYLNLPFIPIQEDNDVYFAQIGFTQGLLIAKKQWKGFMEWYSDPSNKLISENDYVHPMLKQLDRKGTEWFPKITKYLIKAEKYIAFPRSSYSVNFHDIGTHNPTQTSWYQVSLTYEKENFRFKEFDLSNAVYDSFLELLENRIKRLNSDLLNYDFEVDLYCSKPKKILSKEYILTTRDLKNYEKAFRCIMKPLEQNILEKIEGEGIYLGKAIDFKFSKLQDIKNKRKLYYFYNESIKRRLLVEFFLIRIFSKFIR